MPIEAAQYGVAAQDAYDDARTFAFNAIDRLDVTPYGGDVVIQFDDGGGFNWQPASGMRLRGGTFRSLTGLSAVYAPGPIGLRVKRATAGVAATLDFEAYSAR